MSAPRSIRRISASLLMGIFMFLFAHYLFHALLENSGRRAESNGWDATERCARAKGWSEFGVRNCLAPHKENERHNKNGGDDGDEKNQNQNQNQNHSRSAAMSTDKSHETKVKPLSNAHKKGRDLTTQAKNQGLEETKQRVRKWAQMQEVRMDPENQIHVVLHALCIPGKADGAIILSEIFDALITSGLYQSATSIRVFAYGNISALANSVLESSVKAIETAKSMGHINADVCNKQVLEIQNQKKIWTQDKEIPTQYVGKIEFITEFYQSSNWFEFPTLFAFQEIAQRVPPESKMLYMHTKGVTRAKDPVKVKWRAVMLDYAVHNYKRSIDLLSHGWDASGLFLRHKPSLHYSGNFLWTIARHVRNLSNIADFTWQFRYGAEFWALSAGDVCRFYAPPSKCPTFGGMCDLSFDVRKIDSSRSPQCK